jgi:hypothetical protein
MAIEEAPFHATLRSETFRVVIDERAGRFP